MELYEHPASRFVAGFFGRVNFLPVTVRGAGPHGATVEWRGHTLHIRAPTPVLTTQAALALRPEHLRLLPIDATTDDGRNALPGRVAAVQFLGNVLRCEVVLEGDIQLLVETTPDNSLSVPGRAVQLVWKADQGALFADPSEPPSA